MSRSVSVNELDSAYITRTHLLDTIDTHLSHLAMLRTRIASLTSQLQQRNYSTRLMRTLSTVRQEAVQQSRQINTLFKQATYATQDDDEKQQQFSHSQYSHQSFIDKLQLLYDQYSVITELINRLCIDSIRLEESVGSQIISSSHTPPITAYVPASPLLSTQATTLKNSVLSLTPRHSSDRLPNQTTATNASNDTVPPIQLQENERVPLIVHSSVNLLAQRHEEFMLLQSNVIELRSIFKDLNEMIQQQQEHIDAVETHIDATHSAVVEAESHLTTAAKHKTTSLLFLGAVSGFALGGVLGAAVGAKTALTLGSVGAVAGLKSSEFVKNKTVNVKTNQEHGTAMLSHANMDLRRTSDSNKSTKAKPLLDRIHC